MDATKRRRFKDSGNSGDLSVDQSHFLKQHGKLAGLEIRAIAFPHYPDSQGDFITDKSTFHSKKLTLKILLL
jgi:hypothetical protein